MHINSYTYSDTFFKHLSNYDTTYTFCFRKTVDKLTPNNIIHYLETVAASPSSMAVTYTE
jgi:hypothetical protein